MSLLDPLLSEFIDVIEWNEDGSDMLAWRFPRYKDAIKWGAQLIVREGQQAIFVNEGRIADSFQPGRHQLSTRNLPLLTTLLSLPQALKVHSKLRFILSLRGGLLTNDGGQNTQLCFAMQN